MGIWAFADSLRLLFGDGEFVGGSRVHVFYASAADADGVNNTPYKIAFSRAALTLAGMYARLRSRTGLFIGGGGAIERTIIGTILYF